MTRRIIKHGVCSNCGRETQLELITKEEVMHVRGEPIKVKVEYCKCPQCGDEVFDPNRNPDPFDKAYREYRQKHALLQPEEIKEWRKEHRLTQGELAKLLGLGTATINRYENGALQDGSHDRLIRLAMDPLNLLKLVERSGDILPQAKKKALVRALREIEAKSNSLDNSISINFGSLDPDEFNGYRRLDLGRLYNAILFFCKDGVLKTKLNKLLFYADFKHFKEYALSISGARYAHIPFGPAPDNYEMYYGALHSRKAIESSEEQYPGGYAGEIIKATVEPDLNLFSAGELRIMASVKEHFAGFNASEITAFSHKEIAYQETNNGDIISYNYANQLNL